jgi:tetratricopeptide (TPR) repeat protein
MFVRRHWLAVSALTVGLAALLATTIHAVGQAQRAERRFAHVRQLSNKFLFDFHDAIATLPNSTELRRQMVRTAIEYLDGLAKEANGDVELLSELAAAYERVGDVQGNPNYSNLGDTRGAFESYARARVMLREISKSAKQPPNLDRAFLNSNLKLADLYSAVGQSEAAERMLNEGILEFHELGASPALLPALALLHVRRGDVRSRQGRIREAVEDYRKAASLIEPEVTRQHDPKRSNELVTVRRRLGESLPAIGDRPGALVQLQSALELAEKVVAQADGNAEYQCNRMAAFLSLGTFLLQEGQTEPAAQHFDSALRIAQTLTDSGARNMPANSAFALVYARHGDLHAFRKQYQEALRSYQQALAAAERASAAEPGNLSYRRDVARHRLSIGNVALEVPDHALALRQLRPALEAADELIAKDPRDQENYLLRAQALRDLAAVHAAKRDWHAAIEENRRALEALQRAPVFRRHEAAVCQQLARAFEELARGVPGTQRAVLMGEALGAWKRAHAAHLEILKVDGDHRARREQLQRIEEQIRLCERAL